ncbi:hypothetical protein [Persicitalea jodogahamensis]|nr:hypothetical protein [Persicitalea jodogahamensis]
MEDEIEELHENHTFIFMEKPQVAMKKPILLLKRDLTKPILQALDRIEKIRQRKANNVDSIILEGLFVLAVSSFENSLNDTLRILLLNIPQKLDIKSENITKKDLIEGSPLKQAVENRIVAISYKSLQEMLNLFVEITGINESTVAENEMNELLEIKATRNLLIHNNLVENSIYNQTSGPNRRSPVGIERKLVIDQDYLYQALSLLRDLLRRLECELSRKYIHYTKIRAIKALFNYVFQTPVMVFENEFEVDITKDTIGLIKSSDRKKSLSSSERFYYDIWIAHSHGNKFELESGKFFSISDKDKFAYFIKNINLLMP